MWARHAVDAIVRKEVEEDGSRRLVLVLRWRRRALIPANNNEKCH
jgi:hypothetical protein